MKRDSLVRRIHERLFSALGPQHWWPAESPLEVIVGAILTQQAAWRNVELAIANLKAERMMSIRRLSRARLATLERLVRPTGFYRQKAKRLRDIMAHIHSRCGGDLAEFLGGDTQALRSELLSLNGVGPETADSILLYAAHRPVFVVDAYTVRMCERIPLPAGKGYSEIQGFFHRNLPRDARMFNEYHALIVNLGKNWCKKARPRCGECVLADLCSCGRERLADEKGYKPR